MIRYIELKLKEQIIKFYTAINSIEIIIPNYYYY